jgi:hypothetical protein
MGDEFKGFKSGFLVWFFVGLEVVLWLGVWMHLR